MRRRIRCKLCGRAFRHNELFDRDHWRNSYCSELCHSVDETLPEVEHERIYDVPVWVARARYNLIIETEQCAAYKEPFNEEEDDIMRDHYDYER